MDFELSEEQQLLKDMVGRFMQDRYGFEDRKKYMAEPDGFSETIWNGYAEQGLLALTFAEEDGGIGGGPVDVMIVMEEMGKALALEPYLPTVVIGGSVLRTTATADQRARLVGDVVGGACKLALAHQEAAARYNIGWVETKATESGGKWTLDGEKTLVLYGGAADKFIVSARASGAADDAAGVGLFLVDADAAGVSVRDYPTQDGLRAAEVSLSGAEAELLGDKADSLPALRQAVDEAIAALLAEAVGAMEKSLWLTVEYVKEREQFGRPIGDFQALQFQGADMFVELELAKSMMMYATMASRDPDPAARAAQISAAKVQVGRSGRVVGERAIQLHGGVGMTMEYAIGHYFKRISIIEKMFGDTDHHLQMLDQAGGLAA